MHNLEAHLPLRSGRLYGQALVEFAIAVPILILLVAGVIELGRGYSYAVATSDAAHDGARYVAGKTATTNGPGITAMCNLIGADLAAVSSSISCATQVGHAPPFVKGVLAAVSSSISCATQVGHAPPFVKGVDYTAPAGGQVVIVVYCGASANCTGSASPLYQSEVDVYVYYGFNDLNLLGGLVTISGSSKTTTSW